VELAFDRGRNQPHKKVDQARATRKKVNRQQLSAACPLNRLGTVNSPFSSPTSWIWRWNSRSKGRQLLRVPFRMTSIPHLRQSSHPAESQIIRCARSASVSRGAAPHAPFHRGPADKTPTAGYFANLCNRKTSRRGLALGDAIRSAIR
jgi:hypothetical protein